MILDFREDGARQGRSTDRGIRPYHQVLYSPAIGFSILTQFCTFPTLKHRSGDTGQDSGGERCQTITSSLYALPYTLALTPLFEQVLGGAQRNVLQDHPVP